jgi:hypothetical protein
MIPECEAGGPTSEVGGEVRLADMAVEVFVPVVTVY